MTSNVFSWAELKDHCRKFGEVTYTDAHFRSGEGRGEVCFEAREDMEKGKLFQLLVDILIVNYTQLDPID